MMAPIRRTGASLAPPSNALVLQNFREGSFEFTGSEAQDGSSREASEEPGSYDGGNDENDQYEEEEGVYDQSEQSQDGHEDHEDILHPLREAANRVGREVERFAEALDGYSPLKAAAKQDALSSAVDLIGAYHGVAVETVGRLREKHASEKRRKEGSLWRNKMRGFKIAQDIDDDMEIDDVDENGMSIVHQQATTILDLHRWEQEEQTWDLLRRMVSLKTKRSVQKGGSKPAILLSREKDAFEAFLGSDDLAMERSTIIKWLHSTANNSRQDIDVLVQDLQQNADRGDIIAHGWLHTKAAIKNQKRIHVWPQAMDPNSPDVQKIHLNSGKTGPLVTQLDPDAVTRQKRKLEAQDEYFERAIWLGCYEMIRRGKSVEDIMEWCKERTEVWRAISICGFPDSDLPGDDEAQSPNVAALWRRMCFLMARNGGQDDYERAAYGLLSGDVQSVEPVCNSWDDMLYMHLNALLKSQYDAYLMKTFGAAEFDFVEKFGKFDAVQYHGEPATASRRLIDSLNKNAKSSEEAKKPMKMIQSVLISKDFGEFVYQQGLALAILANDEVESKLIPATGILPDNPDADAYIDLEDHDSLRVLVHMILIHKALGVDLYKGSFTRTLAVENIIVAYITFLRLAGMEELIPLYAAQLTGDRRYGILSKNLIDMTDRDQRITQLNLMRELGLDVQYFVRFQTRDLLANYQDKTPGWPAKKSFSILEKTSLYVYMGYRMKSDFFGSDDVDIIDRLLIQSLEWYLLVDGLWLEAFRAGTLIYLRFLKHANLAACRRLFAHVPCSEIFKRMTTALVGESLDFQNLEVEVNETREDVTQSFDDSPENNLLFKRNFLLEAKSYRDLEVLVEALDSLETVNSVMDLLQEDTGIQDKLLRQQLSRELIPLSSAVKLLLRDWLLNVAIDLPEFKLVRESYLPETILAYLAALHAAGFVLSRNYLLEAMELSTIIAAEESDLGMLFVRTDRMSELVKAFAFTSKSILKLNEQGKKNAPPKRMRELGWTRQIWDVKLPD